MNTNHKIFFAFILGVVAKVLTNPWILGYTNQNYSVHRNKIYDAIFFGSITGLIQIILDLSGLNNIEKVFWILLYVSILLVSAYFIDNQVYIGEKQLLLKLRENVGESIRVSEIQLENKDLNTELRAFLEKQNADKIQSIKDINKFIANNKV